MNKKISAIALVAAGFVAQNAHATIAGSVVSIGSQIAMGCSVPTGTNGSTVYSLDINQLNAAYTSAGLSGVDVVALPSGVSIGATCNFAVSALNSVNNLSTVAGKWVAAGSTSSASVGASPVNVTVPGSGYSLQAYTFVAQ